NFDFRLVRDDAQSQLKGLRVYKAIDSLTYTDCNNFVRKSYELTLLGTGPWRPDAFPDCAGLCRHALRSALVPSAAKGEATRLSGDRLLAHDFGRHGRDRGGSFRTGAEQGTVGWHRTR